MFVYWVFLSEISLFYIWLNTYAIRHALINLQNVADLTSAEVVTKSCVLCILGKCTDVQIPYIDGPDRTLSLVGFGRAVSKFHYKNPTRPDPWTAWVSDKSANFVWS